MHFTRSREEGFWCERAMVTQLAELPNQFRHGKVIAKNSTQRELSQEQPQPWTPKTAKIVKRNFQRQVAKLLAEDTAFQAV